MANVTGMDIVNKAKSFVGKYAKHKNKFTEHFAGKYTINKNGYMKAGYCTIFALYVYDVLGILSWFPKKSGNTNAIYKYLKSKGKIITDPKKAKAGMPAFKKVGSTKKKSSGHTSIFWKYEDGKVWTIDGNVSGGVVIRKKKPEWYLGFGDILQTTAKKKTPQKALHPMANRRVSCAWNEGEAHKKCSSASANYRDFPTDLVGKDTGRDWAMAPCDMIVLRRFTSASHAIWLRSVEEVQTPYGVGYLYMMSEHQDNSEMAAVGHIYKQGTKMFREGKNGNATGNHLHVSFGFSKTKQTAKTMGTGWIKNNKGAWVLHIPKVTNIKIEKAVYF